MHHHTVLQYSDLQCIQVSFLLSLKAPVWREHCTDSLAQTLSHRLWQLEGHDVNEPHLILNEHGWVLT